MMATLSGLFLLIFWLVWRFDPEARGASRDEAKR
jgi:H+/Cl- antiporter ClcA